MPIRILAVIGEGYSHYLGKATATRQSRHMGKNAAVSNVMAVGSEKNRNETECTWHVH